MAYLKLFRFPNLLMIILIQYLIRYCIIIPALTAYNLAPVLNDLFFFLLVLSCVLISAAGYAINDYFDLRIDRINKPDKIILGKNISRRQAIFFHSFFNILGVLLAIIVAVKVHLLRLTAIHIFAVTFLWFYAIYYKRRFLTGNIIIALLTTLIIITVWLFEFWPRSIYTDNTIDFTQVRMIILVYAGFAFLTTLIREIIKDIEDIEGDKKVGCKTMPVVWGIDKARYFVVFLIMLLIVSVIFLQDFFWKEGNVFYLLYSLLLIQIPFIIVIIKIIRAKTKEHFAFLNLFTKIIILMGVLSILLLLFKPF
jgi:4-hydroxybenzoate polyprenyltransferase